MKIDFFFLRTMHIFSLFNTVSGCLNNILITTWCVCSISPNNNIGTWDQNAEEKIMHCRRLLRNLNIERKTVPPGGHSPLMQNMLFWAQDPSRNHRAYRLAVAKLSPPYIPFMPLILKGNQRLSSLDSNGKVRSHHWRKMTCMFCLLADMTFIHEGNPNLVDRLVNFEKMVRQTRAY